MSLGRLAKSLLRRAGLGVYRVNRGQIIPPQVSDAHCYAGPEDFSRLYRPWTAPDFSAELGDAVRENTMLSPQKLYTLRQLFRSTCGVAGDVFEAGTCSGGAARLLLDAATSAGISRTFWLLDTFAGYQKIDAARDGAHVQIADCRGKTVAEVADLLATDTQRVRLVPGLIPESLGDVRTDAIAFAHIDVNLHEPTRAATEFCLERMPAGGIIVFDDYNWPATYGARQAIDEVVAAFRQHVVCLPESTQAFLIRQTP